MFRLRLLFSLTLLGLSQCLSSSIQRPIPVTVLSGFLGSGKTTLLQHLLHKRQGLRIAVVVNDMASVNIDSKLIGSTMLDESNGIVQLQNGCACCSKSDELLSSLSELVLLSDLRGEELAFDHIVVEMSGVADPKSVRAKFQEAILYDMPLMDRVRLDTMVTLVDSTTFLQFLASGNTVDPNDTPELFHTESTFSQSTVHINDAPSISSFSSMGVSELLIAQTETSDVVLLNKVDISDDNSRRRIRDIVSSLNSRATIYETTYGTLDPNLVLAVAAGHGTVESGIVDDHRDAVQAATGSHSSNHFHNPTTFPSNETTAMGTPSLATLDLQHSPHDTFQHSQENEVMIEPDYNLDSHSHSHDHHQCSGPDCTHDSHAQPQDNHECNDPDCTHDSHSHSHDHSSNIPSTNHAGLGAFVYRARRPFHPRRLLALVRHLPVVRGLPDDKSLITLDATSPSTNTLRALAKTLRSKGFIWCADSNIAALYWSHAGASFDLQCLGRWWSTLPRDQWPPEAISSLLSDFDDPHHTEGSQLSVGDRRQEIVFIGQGIGNLEEQQALQQGLDQCLLQDDEWLTFLQNRSSEQKLQTLFVNPIPTRMVSY
jgi:G3E family GTPase